MQDNHTPNLIIIGAMKCGTTSLHEYLDRHPDVGMSKQKELDYFVGNNSDKPLGWYRAQFDPSKAVRGESSQNYSKAHFPWYAGAPEKIAALIPDAKLIYVVRDPIERYRSHIVENYLGETDSARQINIAQDGYVKTGLYYYQLSFFLEHFPQEQIMVVDLDDLNRDRLAVMNRIFSFLGLSEMSDPALFDFTANANGEDILPPRIRQSRPYRAIRKLAPELTKRTVSAPLVRRTLFSGSLKAPLSAEEHYRLSEAFALDLAALRALTGQRFAGWQV